jgi:hypothetical protein
MTAAEVRALFTDLPAPHPKLPGSTPGGMRRNLVFLAVVAVLVLAGVLAFGIGREGPEPSPAPGPAALPTANVVPTADPVAPPEASATPSFASTGAAGVLPGGAAERRTTEGVAITLRPSYGVDLDDDTSPNWGVSRGGYVRDITLSGDASEVTIDNDYARMTGSPDYAACARETGYTSGGIERGSLQPGDDICVRTGGRHFALVTIVSASEQGVQFQATVWDPQISS